MAEIVDNLICKVVSAAGTVARKCSSRLISSQLAQKYATNRHDLNGN